MPTKGHKGWATQIVWTCLNAHPEGMSAMQLAEATGLGVDTVRPALGSLHRSGNVKSYPTGKHSGGRNGGGEPKFIWKATGLLSSESSAAQDLARALNMTPANMIPRTKTGAYKMYLSPLAAGGDDD